MCENNMVTGIIELLKNALNCKEDIEDGRMDIRSTKYNYSICVYTFGIEFSKKCLCSAMKNIISYVQKKYLLFASILLHF